VRHDETLSRMILSGGRGKVTARTKYNAFLLSLPCTLQLSRNVPAYVDVMRHDGTVHGATIKGTLCRWTQNWRAWVKTAGRM